MADDIEDFSVYYDHGSGRYCCDTCNKYFTQQSDIEQHLYDAPVHTDDCFRCRRSFVDDTALAQHCRDSLQHWLCEGLEEDECDFDGHTYEELCQHWEQTNHYQYCRTCLTRDTGWLTANKLRSHRLKEHPFVGRTCGNKFLTDFELHTHHSKKHPTRSAPSNLGPAAQKHSTREFPGPTPAAADLLATAHRSMRAHDKVFGAQGEKPIGRTPPLTITADTNTPYTDDMSVNDRLSRWTEEALRVAAQNKQGRHTLFAKENASPATPLKQAAPPSVKDGSTPSSSTPRIGTSKNSTTTASSTTSAESNPPTTQRSFASAALKRDGLIAGAPTASTTQPTQNHGTSTTHNTAVAQAAARQQETPRGGPPAQVSFRMPSAGSGAATQSSSRGGLSSSKYADDDPLAVLPPRINHAKQPQTEQQANNAATRSVTGSSGQSSAPQAPSTATQRMTKEAGTTGPSAPQHERAVSRNSANPSIRTAPNSFAPTAPIESRARPASQQPPTSQQQARSEPAPVPGSKHPAQHQAVVDSAIDLNTPRAPRADSNQARARPGASQSKLPCFGSCGQWFDTTSSIAKHIETGACTSKMTTADIYKTAATCESRHLFIHGRYHMDMELDRNLTKKYYSNAWPFFCPKPPCEEVFRSLGELFEHIESGECKAAQRLDEEPIRELVDALQYRGAHGLL